MTEFFRFPHTAHIAWLGAGAPRGDKVLSPDELRELLAGEVLIEEKIDGANLGFSVDERGALRAQNRGAYLELATARGQWKPLTRWLAPRRQALAEALGPALMLFGEWCYAVHSVRYSRLPDWFLAFDVYDRAAGEFWSVARRRELTAWLGLAEVPERARGVFEARALERLLGESALTDGPAEGIVVRREEAGRLRARGKLVRAEFVQAIEEHWSRRALEPNRLAAWGDRARD